MWKSPTITKDGMMAKKMMYPIHPGEILMEEFLEPLGVSQYRLAKDISVPPRRTNEIVHGRPAITAVRLCGYRGTSALRSDSGSVSGPATSWKWRKITSRVG